MSLEPTSLIESLEINYYSDFFNSNSMDSKLSNNENVEAYILVTNTKRKDQIRKDELDVEEAWVCMKGEECEHDYYLLVPTKRSFEILYDIQDDSVVRPLRKDGTYDDYLVVKVLNSIDTIEGAKNYFTKRSIITAQNRYEYFQQPITEDQAISILELFFRGDKVQRVT